MKDWTLLVAAALAVCWPCAAVQADVLRIDPDAAYSATRVIENDKTRIEQRYFQQSVTVHRMETELRGEQSIMILRGDRNLMWTIMPSKRMVMELTLDGGTVPNDGPELPDYDHWVEVKEVGSEAVHGVPATKYYVASSDDDGTRMQGHVWVSDHGIPVRMELASGKQRTHMELRDLAVAPQPASLFEPPADYQKFAVTGGAGNVLQNIKGTRVGGPGAARAGPPPAPTAAAVVAADGEPGFVEELATESVEDVKQTTKDEVRGSVRETVKKGLRELFPIK
jgi:hypothetical protein